MPSRSASKGLIQPCWRCGMVRLRDELSVGRDHAESIPAQSYSMPKRLTKRSPPKEYFTVVAVVLRSDSR